MAEIDHRVRLLTDLLMAQGFTWLASEIIATLELGRAAVDDTDHTVSSQREELRGELSKFDAPLARGALRRELSKEATIDELESLAETIDGPRIAFSSDEQVEAAVEVLTFRLSDSARMLAASVETLEEIFGTEVDLFTEVEGELRSVNAVQARTFASQLKNLQVAFRDWLLNQQPTDEG